MMARLAQLARLALADLRGEWPIALAQVIAIAAVLTPLLVLFGLREGAIGTLIDRLDRDPAMRLLTPEATGANRFAPDWFAAMAARPDVAFVISSTRMIAGQIDLLRREQDAAGEVRVTLLPTADGDPVTGAEAGAINSATARFDTVVVSARVAERLGVAAGAPVTGYVERVRDGTTEPLAIRLSIAAVLPIARDGGLNAFGSLALVEAVQDFRDGKAVPAIGVAEGETARPAADYPLFRLYTRSIRDVGPLAAELRANGIAIAAREAEIASTLALDQSLRAVLLIISGLSVAGYVVAVTAGQWGNLRRKRRDFAVLNLTGYGTAWLVALPVAQAMVLALAGSAAGVAGFATVAGTVNQFFRASISAGEAACRLAPGDLAAAVAITVALSLGPAAAIGLAFHRIDINEELRDV